MPPTLPAVFCFLAALALVTVPACSTAPGLVLPPAAAGAPTTPGPSPRLRTFDAAGWNVRCEGCHQEIAAEWQASLHHLAHTDPTYQQQLAREPGPFCTSCHAPEAPATGPVPEALGRLGVGCVTCHVVGDQILAAPRADGTDHDGEHHPLTRTTQLLGAAACGACHEFPFPDARRRGGQLLMQSTISEHAASTYADHTCASCHMPWTPGGAGGGHHNHTFSASRDDAFVRSAIVVEERPIEGNTLTLVLRPGRVGHAFPTGDMLRRLAVTIDVLDAEGQVIEHKTHYLARHFGFARAPNLPLRRTLVKDNRVGVGPDPLVLRHTMSHPPAGGHIHYVVRYERVADPEGGADGRSAVEGSVLLADRTLPVPGSTAVPGPRPAMAR